MRRSRLHRRYVDRGVTFFAPGNPPRISDKSSNLGTLLYMPVREVSDRRGRPLRGSAGLLERDSPLQAIAAVLDALDSGGGDALLLEGHAGMGKTRLHEAALDEARRRGIRVLRAAGAELEQNVALGVAGQLVRALLHDLPEDARRI